MNYNLSEIKYWIVIVSTFIITVSIYSCQKHVDLIDNNTNTMTPLPLIITDSVSSIRATCIIINAEINTGELNATYHFEYGISNTYGDSTIERDLKPDSTTISIQDSITKLLPGTLYHYRLVASNANGKSLGKDKIFTTRNVILPSVAIFNSKDYTTNSATLQATVGPNGKSGTYNFEYGVNASYDLKTQEKVFDGAFNFLASETVYGLKYGTQYHWRIHVRVDSGEVWSSDAVFSTLKINNPVEFLYRLSIGQSQSYNYHLTEEDVYGGLTPLSKEIRGNQIWTIESQQTSNDSTIYNVMSTIIDTVFTRVQVNMPPDTSYENTSIPFTIVFTDDYIYVGFDRVVKYAHGVRSLPIVPVPRIVENGTSQLQLGNVLYENGVGLKFYNAGFFSNTGGYIEQLTLQ